MRSKLFIMIPAAIGLGFIAVKAGRQWLDRQVEDRVREAGARSAAPAAVRPETTFGTIVVAGAKLKFGMELAPNLLKEIPWPDGQKPIGAFTHVGEVTDGGVKRFVLSSIEEGEAILANRITGPGQRADLAAVLEDGKKALTVRVDEVVGIAGFLLPGERVDVVLTRSTDKSSAVTDVILQNIRVLAIDQLSDDRASKPTVGRTATVEVSTEEAQRLIVAQNVGALTFVLRPLGEQKDEKRKRISTADLAMGPGDRDADMPVAGFAPRVTVGVTRGGERKEYTVPPSRSN